MNHLKIHAYIPEADGLEEEESHSIDEYSESEKVKKKKQVGRRKKKEIKEEYDSFEGKLFKIVVLCIRLFWDPTYFSGASSSKGYTYIEENSKYIDQMQGEDKGDGFEYLQNEQEYEEEIIRYPVTDPKKPFVCQHCGVGKYFLDREGLFKICNYIS